MTHTPERMIDLPGGSFWMGSDDHYPEEAPARLAEVGPFAIDIHPVTNRQFADFVDATGHLTLAEVAPDAADYPDARPDLLVPGSALFVPPPRGTNLTDHLNWWSFVPGTDWRHPWGPESGLAGLDEHPVVHVAYVDALAFAEWAGKALPTEAEWEYAARGGLVRQPFAWGPRLRIDGRVPANIWTGDFPKLTSASAKDFRTSPVGRYPANGFGLFDMIGNVWEWTSDWFDAPEDVAAAGCCTPPRAVGNKVLKGGSHLCAPNYCQRYRPAARHPQSIDTSTSHIGFRCVRRPNA